MLQPAVKKETVNVTVITSVSTILMLLVFFVLHLIFPDAIPFDYTVILGGICGAAIAIFNFFLMAVTVQKVASMEDRDEAGKLLKTSYSRRLMLQCVWIIVAIFAPCFHSVAGILPILFPGIGIRVYGIFRKDFKNDRPSAANSADAEALETVDEIPNPDSSDSDNSEEN